MNWRDHIVQSQDTCLGKPRIRGTRVTVELILRSLGAGMTASDIEREYGVSAEAIGAALSFTAELLDRVGTGQADLLVG